MLQSLVVKNFAIIDNINIDFSSGMTVLTGETGAGKSLIIDAIALLFGERASSEQVRYGEQKAVIEGVFFGYSPNINTILEKNEIDSEDFLIVKREIYSTGKSLSKINGETVNLNTLSEIANELGDIHTQFEAIKLVNPKNYFDFLDDSEIHNLLNLYQTNLKEFRRLNNEYLQKKQNETEMLQKLDYLKYQLSEIKKANLSFEEEVDLQNQLKILNNHEKIFSNYYEFINCYNNNDLLKNLYESINILQRNVQFDSSLQEKISCLEESYYAIEDVFETINTSIKNDDISYDISAIDNINERLSIYSELKRKYKMSTEELIQNLKNLEKEVDELENYDFYLEELTKEKNKFYNETLEIGENISTLRKKNALYIKTNILKILSELSLKNTTFDIVFKEDKPLDKFDSSIFKNNGIDIVDFLISFNKGERLLPLSKVASGGELSRFMLSLKALSFEQMSPKTFIFDEIDSGVSGEIAYNIASKIKDISKKHQVLCVTHLPQVAAISDNHLFITKSIVDTNRTITNIKKLTYDERVSAIALMISKGKETVASIALAKELLLKN